jgi:hypothetical protein
LTIHEWLSSYLKFLNLEGEIMIGPNQENNDDTITIIQADPHWLINQRNKSLLILSVGGLIIFILSIIFQDIVYALIRGLIFVLAGCLVYLKPNFVYNYRIQFYRGGRIIVKKGLRKSEIFVASEEKIQLVKKGRNWQIGSQKVKVPIEVFPDLEMEVRKIEKM